MQLARAVIIVVAVINPLIIIMLGNRRFPVAAASQEYAEPVTADNSLLQFR